jgi:hypothetical protein
MPTAKRTALVTGASGLAGGYKPEGFEEAERSFRPPKLFSENSQEPPSKRNADARTT